uniref:Uncharacterized protein n=1 Tax=Noctiluca scintillans TaxID=2966 RepID=A0A7S1F2R5_NOCSC|mmetsp:Transcript_27360/g.72055  ORF Transcript_27360/g.72055 Transcript_27360/m.72055 type:complete len:146 (+) Transcript_27360:193-630(+)
MMLCWEGCTWSWQRTTASSALVLVLGDGRLPAQGERVAHGGGHQEAVYLGCLDRDMFRRVTGGLGPCLSVGPLDFPLWGDGTSGVVGHVEDGTELRRSVLCLAPKQPFSSTCWKRLRWRTGIFFGLPWRMTSSWCGISSALTRTV